MNFICRRMLLLLIAASMLAGTAAAAVDLTKAKIVRGNRTIAEFSVEVAGDETARAQGLAGRESLSEVRAMLFVLKRNAPTSFWMKGMRFPIDLLFFDKEGVLIRILPMLQPCDADCPLHSAPADTAYALEVKGGTVGALGIEIGDSLLLKKWGIEMQETGDRKAGTGATSMRLSLSSYD